MYGSTVRWRARWRRAGVGAGGPLASLSILRLAVHVLVFLARLEAGWRQEARLTVFPRHQSGRSAQSRHSTKEGGCVLRRTGVTSSSCLTRAEEAAEIQICSRCAVHYNSAGPEKLASCLPLVLNPLSRWHALLPAQVSWKGGHFHRREAELPSQGSADLPDRRRQSSFRRKNFLALELAPQARQTSAFQGCWFAFPRARVFQRQACGLKKKKKSCLI